MPVNFLSDADHDRLNRCPTDIESEDLDRFFLLSDDERKTIQRLRGEHNQLGFGVQLGCLRYLGFFPEDLQQLPKRVVEYVAQQLQLSSSVLERYGKRGSTQRNHQRQIQTRLGYRRASPIDLLDLEQWLLNRALEHDKPLLLFQMACDRLKQNNIIRIGTTRLEKIVATARSQAQDSIYQSLQSLLSQEFCALLDKLLIVDDDLRRTRLSWLQHTPTDNNPKQILETLDKIIFLKDYGVDSWDLSDLNPNRVNYLAKVGARATNQSLQRSIESKRYPILITFLKQSLYHFTDDLIEMFNQRLWTLYTEAKRKFEADRLKATKTLNEKLKTFQNIGQILLDDSIEDDTVRATAFDYISREQLQTSLKEAADLIRPDEDAYVDYFCQFYPRVRRISTKFLATLTFQARGDDQGLIQALQFVHEIHTGERRKLPDDAPTDFILKTWRAYVIETEDEINWRHYELAALWVLRQKLRSGDVYLYHSRRFNELSKYFIPAAEWQLKREDIASLTGTPLNGLTRFKERERELIALLEQVESIIDEADSDLREEDGKLVLSPITADERTVQLEQLTHTIGERLPRLDITDLLVEVDNWTQFSSALEHLNSPGRRDPSVLQHLYTCLLAQACNMDFQQMANSTGVSYRRLKWYNTWYIRDETLQAANTTLVNYHYHLPLSQLWGGGILSSSDGQRFPAKGAIRQARALPRYFGYRKGMTFYSWTSDQFSQYGSKPIPSTIRDATYVLDEILNNETELSIVEHTTDTAGYTELMFALFDLLGLRFSPRIRDLADQKLYRTCSIDMDAYPKLKDHVQEVIQKERFLPDWDEMLRLVGSLKTGWVTASLIVQKLQAFPRKHPLMRALQEYGKLPKTIHILRWYADEANRRRLNRQLNKGEALHSLRSHLFFANQGELRSQQDEQLRNQVGCLNLVTNAVIVWNTVYIDKVVEQLRQEGLSISDEDLKGIWPTRHSNLNVYGKYFFNLTHIGQKQSLRPLRQPAIQP
ncbi:MAG: Tn3 family transposase [Cyanobacteria bacterium P01_F01_bin.86]